MGMLTKLNELSKRQQHKPARSDAQNTPTVRRIVSKGLLAIVTRHSSDFLEEWVSQPDWKTTKYLGMMMLRQTPEDIEVYTKLVPLEEGIAELREPSNQLPYSDALEQRLLKPIISPGRRYCLPIYVALPNGGSAAMFLSTDDSE